MSLPSFDEVKELLEHAKCADQSWGNLFREISGGTFKYEDSDEQIAAIILAKISLIHVLAEWDFYSSKTLDTAASDFGVKSWQVTEYVESLREKLSIGESDLIIYEKNDADISVQNNKKTEQVTPDLSPVPLKARSYSQNFASGKNQAIAAGGGIILFISVVILATYTSKTSNPAVSMPSASSTQSAANPLWGAWAVTTEGDRHFGASWDAAIEEEAKRSALNYCTNSGGVKCEIIISFGSGHAALASGSNQWFGVGGHASADEARNEAIKGCKREEADPETCSIDEEFSF